MSNIYGDILEVLQNIEEENRNREHFLNSIPSTRANLCRSVLFPNTRKFIPAEALDGTISLMPGNQNLNLFRGQKTQNYPLCVAKIYRNNPSEIDIFISRLRQIEFELVLREVFQDWRNIMEPKRSQKELSFRKRHLNKFYSDMTLREEQNII